METHLPDAAMKLCIDEFDDDPDGAVRAAARGYPAMFAKLFHDGGEYGVDRETLAERAGKAWAGPGDRFLRRESWRELFDLAGY